MFAVKIFPNSPYQISDAALQLAETNPAACGIEIGLYAVESLSDDLTARVAALPRGNKVLHSYLFEIGLADIVAGREETLARLASEQHESSRLGLGRSVVHAYRQIGHAEKTMADYPSPEDAAKLWARGAMQMADMGMRPLFEKTFESLAWFERFFTVWDTLGIANRTGFCLDIGHTRVWQRESLDHWLAFTKYLQARGFAIQFHIHGNDGSKDAHRPLHLAHAEGLLAPAADWAPRGVMPWLKDAIAAHPDSLFTLENDPTFAAPCFDFAQSATM